MITMRRFFRISFALLLSLLTVSCDKDNSQDQDNSNSPKSKEFSLLLGEWKWDKTEGYKNNGTLVYGHPGKSGVYLIFKSSGEYINHYYASFENYKGSFKIKNNILTLSVEYLNSQNTVETETDGCEILELTDEKLVIKRSWEDSSSINYSVDYYSRVRAYDLDFKMSEDAKKIVGVWRVSNFNNINYWSFSDEGYVYVGDTKDVGPFDNIKVKTWSFDDETRILITTLTWNDINKIENYTYGNYTYAWKLLSISDKSMSGQAMYGKQSIYTFERF